MRSYGLVGYPLSHSFSKKFFLEKFKKEGITNANYENYSIKNIENLRALIDKKKLLGLNITIPYKTKVIALLDSIEPQAKEINAVNCIKIERKDRKPTLTGYNTDMYGFAQSILPYLSHINAALILGNGGASKAVQYILDKKNISFSIVTRNKDQFMHYQDIDQSTVMGHQLIVNTTPLGTFPDINQSPPIPYKFLSSKHILFDLVYNPPESSFLKEGTKHGCQTINGYDMLCLQALKSWQIWNKQ